jgi:hypothetical protein
MDREMTKQVDRLRRNIAEVKDLALSLPELREEAEEAFRDAMQDGTIKHYARQSDWRNSRA